jgi:hypothetical protein
MGLVMTEKPTIANEDLLCVHSSVRPDMNGIDLDFIRGQG